jgi:hypothetical protein
MIKTGSKGASRLGMQSQSASISKLIDRTLLGHHRAPLVVIRADLLIALKRTKFQIPIHDRDWDLSAVPSRHAERLGPPIRVSEFRPGF